MKPAAPVTSSFTQLLQVGAGVIAEHEPRSARPDARALDLDVPAEQRVLDAMDTLDAAVVQHDRVLDLGVDQHAVVGDRGVRPDVGVDQPGARTDDRRSSHYRAE